MLQRTCFHHIMPKVTTLDGTTLEAALIVVWRVVDSCNLSCPFCAFDRRLAFPRTHTDPADILRFAAVLADHQARTGDGVLLSWLGGEPLLWRPLENLTLAIRVLVLA